MDGEKPKTPQEELEELLRQAGGQAPAKSAAPRVEVPDIGMQKTTLGGRVARLRPNIKIDSRWWLIGGLALVMLLGTVFYFSSVASQKHSGIEVASNQPDISLQVGSRTYGGVDDGYRLGLRPGEYSVRASKQGYLDFDLRVKVTKKQYSTITLDWLPVPTLSVVANGVARARLAADSSEISYVDPVDNKFKTRVLDSETVAELFRGAFPGVTDVVWSRVGQAALVKITGMPKLANMVDNRGVKGRYIPLGESPEQAPTASNGVSTWYFDDARKTAAGWQPVLLSENIRQVAFSEDGSQIVYIYEGGDGERSLVQAQPDGLEWERVITDLPSFNNPKLVWSPDTRFLLIIDGEKVYIADLLSKTIEQTFSDWVVGSQIAFDPTGTRLVYFSGEGADRHLVIYELFDGTSKEVAKGLVTDAGLVNWMSFTDVVVAGAQDIFLKINVDTETRVPIPFSGVSIGGPVEEIQYSSRGRGLMIISSGSAYFMRV